MRAAETAPAAPQTGDARGAGAASSSATVHDDDDRGAADAANDPAAPVPASARVPEAAPDRRYDDDDGRGEAGPAAAVKSGILSSVRHTFRTVIHK